MCETYNLEEFTLRWQILETGIMEACLRSALMQAEVTIKVSQWNGHGKKKNRKKAGICLSAHQGVCWQQHHIPKGKLMHISNKVYENKFKEGSSLAVIQLHWHFNWIRNIGIFLSLRWHRDTMLGGTRGSWGIYIIFIHAAAVSMVVLWHMIVHSSFFFFFFLRN